MITERQQAILDFIVEYAEANGFPPSVREIGRHFDIYPATVQDHISALERKGFLQKKRFQSRTLSVPMEHRTTAGRQFAAGTPIVGRVAAGKPILAEENIDEVVQLPKDWAPEGAFLLKVAGDSMVQAHILDGDYVLVHPTETATNGEIVVAQIGDDATVKRFYRTKKGVTLKAENPKYAPIELAGNDMDSFRLAGRVMGVFRVLKK